MQNLIKEEKEALCTYACNMNTDTHNRFEIHFPAILKQTTAALLVTGLMPSLNPDQHHTI